MSKKEDKIIHTFLVFPKTIGNVTKWWCHVKYRRNYKIGGGYYEYWLN